MASIRFCRGMLENTSPASGTVPRDNGVPAASRGSTRMPVTRQPWTSAAPYLPRQLSLTSLRRAAAGCHGCPLYAHATQTVFGAGRLDAKILLVGEQPGNDEDLAGAPFVGPAGRVLNSALAGAGNHPAPTYVTNVVQQFKWTASRKRRVHQKPDTRRIARRLAWV